MDRLNQLRGEAGPSRDSTLDTSSPPSEAYITANENSKYFSLSEVDSTFDISPIKDATLSSSSIETQGPITEQDRLISNLSPIGKKNDFLDSYKIGKQIEAANILSGGVDIFDDNDNSYDGDELVIDDNAVIEDKGNSDLKIAEAELKDDNSTEATLVEAEPVPSKDTEVILQIDGKNVDAIDIGNGLYLYRREGEEELAAVQIDEDQQQPSFKFLKVRENAEGNLEVYEEIPIEDPKELPVKEGKLNEKNDPHITTKETKDTSDKQIERISKKPSEQLTTVVSDTDKVSKRDQSESKIEVNGKLMKISEISSRKSPVVGSFTPMAFHSTPNKERIPLTKTMVDLQLHPNRHSDNVKKTIEVHTDSSNQKRELQRNQIKDFVDDKNKQFETNNKTEKCSSEDTNNKNSKESVEDKCMEVKTGEKEKYQDDNTIKPITENIDIKPDQNIDRSDNTVGNVIELPITENNYQADIVQKEILPGKENASEPPVTDSLNSFEKFNDENVEVNQQNQDSKLEEIEINNVIENISTQNFGKNNKMETIKDEPRNKDNIKIDNKSDLVNLDKEVCLVNINNSNEESVSNITLPCSSDISNKIIDSTESINDNKINVESKNLISIDTKAKSRDNIEGKYEILQEKLSFNLDAQTSLDKNIIESGSVNKKEPKPDNEMKLQNTVVSKIDLVTEDINTSKKVDSELSSNEKSDALTLAVDSSNKHITNIIIASKKENRELVDTINKESATTFDDTKKESSDRSNTLKPDSNKEIMKMKRSTADSQMEELIPDDIVNISKKVSHEIVQQAKKEIQPKTVSNDVKTIGIAIDNKFPTNIENKDSDSKQIKPEAVKNVLQEKAITDKKVTSKVTTNIDLKSVSNHAAVPFGKWTEANRQAFLNRIKETKVPSNSSNGKQIKNSNDLNRRDFLKKIDTHRQASTNINATKVQDFGSGNRLSVKKEASVFSNKPVTQESKLPVKTESLTKSGITGAIKKVPKQETITKIQTNATPIQMSDTTVPNKKEPSQRKEINNQDLIDKTIEDIINRVAPSKSHEENMKETQSKDSEIAKLDELEMKMNELHGIPFIERPPHELPILKNPVKIYTKPESQKVSLTKQTKIPNLVPVANKNQQKDVKENFIDIDSEEEVIEHEPITGDMELVKNNVLVTKKSESITQITNDTGSKEAIITEKDFDKFVRRNSISYENCITVNFDSKESPNVVNTIVQKDTDLKTYTRQEKYNTKLNVINEQLSQSTVTKSIQNMKFTVARNEVHSDKNYQSKVKMAYQTAMTAKRQMEKPISILEDKPVKVVFVDNNSEINPRQLNAHGKELSPPKKTLVNVDLVASTNSLDSDILELEDAKNLEDSKNKTKHQRKQVLTPVDTPDLELIEPDDLGIEVSPKKKRKTDEKVEKGLKAVVPKKSYLLGRTPVSEETITKSYELPKVFNKEAQAEENNSLHKNTASAIDSLVKAAELLETQSGNILNKSANEINNFDSQQNTPVKRGRGRPRKYPLPEGSPVDRTKVPSPKKKPRLDDAKINKSKDTDEDDDSNSDEEMVKENWTMGKINENIVCPICDKLFRSENVVFKHVKHCTGSSPNRSESGSRSPRRFRESQDSESKCDSMDIDEYETLQKDVRKKRKSRDTNPKPMNESNEVIVIEDTPIKPKPEKREQPKYTDSRKSVINKSQVNSLICEFCGKTFRQLSYLANHKLQHEKAETKKVEPTKSVYSCEFCKKEFRQLHHLVQHRIIHNSSVTTAAKRKNSSEQNENKTSKEQTYSKQNDDASAGFRCEPCDKSFRKLHHLVEHRETHDGINRQKSTTVVQAPVEKPPPPPQCEICKKTFRKLHHLIEHKEQHMETSSEKSDDKSIKSSLSTKDIIHECSLCYMVFPNEHSLNKHTFICQRKKRQSATKQQAEQIDNSDDNRDDVIIETSDIRDHDSESIQLLPSTKENSSIEPVQNAIDLSKESHNVNIAENIEEPVAEIKETNVLENKVNEDVLDIVGKEKPIDDKDNNKILDKPKETVKLKKTPAKDKVAQNITKRHKTNQQATKAKEVKTMESSDDDEVRYMLNPDYKIDNINEEKLFMKVRAKKRNSLQIERPDSKDLIKRRISLQHPPKIPRLKPKSVPTKTVPNASILTKTVKPVKLEPVPSMDSDDSDVKYSFPKAVVDKINKPASEPLTKEHGNNKSRKSLADKRKSLTGISKKKSLGKVVTPKHKVKALAVNVKLIKKRIAEVEHRCDCGQLFSSAALLSRHTSLAHTPPRIRRRRSPPPELTNTKPAKQASTALKPRLTDSRKSSIKSDAASTSKTSQTALRKSSIPKADTKPEPRKSIKSSDKSTPTRTVATKERRNVAHKGVPVPEKMRKYMEKCKK